MSVVLGHNNIIGIKPGDIF